ncbi:MAG TPA: glycosyl hydrolase family 28-related protein, partial [Gemmatimonadaceae bacterium]|nr:glycosyl hydrolase family 28-related protein [Gemmatimonadaceae bacterium]
MTMISGGRAGIRTAALALGLWATSISAAQPARTAAAQKTFDVTQYGATGRRGDSATKAIQDAIDACADAGGGVVYVPPGEYTTGAIRLKDNVDLHVQAGATLFLSQDRAEFPAGSR